MAKNKVTFELRQSGVYFTNGNLVLNMIRSKALDKILKVNEFHKGYIAADCIMTFNGKQSVMEEYFDFEDVLCMLGLQKYKDNYFKGVKKEDICVINL